MLKPSRMMFSSKNLLVFVVTFQFYYIMLVSSLSDLPLPVIDKSYCRNTSIVLPLLTEDCSRSVQYRHNLGILNTSSTRFNHIAAATISKVLPCLKSAPWYKTEASMQYVFPDDAEEHFRELKNITAKYYTTNFTQVFDNDGEYKSMWIDNLFVQKYVDAPLHTFRGLFPIFAQWYDIQIHNNEKYNLLINELTKVLRPNCLYFTVSYKDDGIYPLNPNFPNVLSISGGGYGHIPIPNIKGELKWTPLPSRFTYDVAFYGNGDKKHSTRKEILGIVRTTAAELNITYNQAQGSSWATDMHETKYNLAPGGQGRSSYRLAEIVQMGRIPIQIYNDIDWAPYPNTEISIDTFGFNAQYRFRSNNPGKTIDAAIRQAHALSESDFKTKMKQLEKKVRYYYTYEGVLKLISQFLLDPFGERGGYLRCAPKIPETTCCCDWPEEET